MAAQFESNGSTRSAPCRAFPRPRDEADAVGKIGGARLRNDQKPFAEGLAYHGGRATTPKGRRAVGLSCSIRYDSG